MWPPMVINNHHNPELMRDLLDIKLFSQPFENSISNEAAIEQAKQIAVLYSRMENGLSVLSDMRARKSYIYYGAIAEQLGLDIMETEIKSIWEDQLLKRVHPEDLQKKYRLEFQFFQLINTVDIDQRSDYELMTKLRIRNKEGKYVLLKHRLLYVCSSDDGSIWLALCLYNLIYDHPEFSIPQGVIVNSRSGAVVAYDQQHFTDLLSAREREVLQLIKHGKRSKDIADKLSLSINTVNRHRQNIFQKLGVTNAFEACMVAESIGVLA